MSENTTTTTSQAGFTEKVRSYALTNRKMLLIAGGALVILVGGYFAYQKMIVEPNNRKSQEQLWKADYYFEIDSFQRALDGDLAAGTLGYKSIAKKYSGTTGGNIANYCMGISYLNTGQYKQAIEALEKCSFDDELVGSIAIGAQGDAYMEMGKINEAIEKYEEAANRTENDFTTPVYLKKAAMAYETKKEFGKAAEIYERIHRDYETTTEARDVEKYLARAKSLAKK